MDDSLQPVLTTQLIFMIFQVGILFQLKHSVNLSLEGGHVHSLKEPNSRPDQDCYSRSICFSPDATRLVTAGESKVLNIWNIETGQLMNQLQGHTDNIFGVDWSPNSSLAVSGSDDNTLKCSHFTLESQSV